MLEEKQKLILSVVVVLVLLVGFGGGIYLKLKERAPLVAEMDRLEASIRLYDQKIAQIGTLTEKIAALQEEVARYEVIMPDSEELDKMADTVDEFRKKSGVEIKDFRKVISPVVAREQAGKAYEQVTYNMKLTGDFFQFVTFINLLENHERFIRVDSFRVSPSRAEDTSLMDVDLQISTFTSRMSQVKTSAGATI